MHPYTFRAEYTDLLWSYAIDLRKELFLFFELEGVDGVFTDFCDQGVKYMERIALGSADGVNFPTKPWNALENPRAHFNYSTMVPC